MRFHSAKVKILIRTADYLCCNQPKLAPKQDAVSADEAMCGVDNIPVFSYIDVMTSWWCLSIHAEARRQRI